MKRFASISVLAAAILAIASVGPAAEPTLVDGGTGQPVGWGGFLEENGPVVLLMWASWAPNAASVIDRHAALSAAGREVEMDLFVVDVQEPLVDAKTALDSQEVAWLHDRHGALLKQYRVIRLPSLVVVTADGEVLARLAPTAEALRSWSDR
ncbi:MAG: TlpA family protein disulfide reductase [Thermoanaerobaculales bacterium]